jgi:hypothetical protein
LLIILYVIYRYIKILVVLGAFTKVRSARRHKYRMLYRPLCKFCGRMPAAVNYRRGDTTHFRSLCSACIRKGKKAKTQTPSWALSGYKKKPHCEKCGFKAKYKEQLFVYHIDGNLNNSNHANLRTICANCQYEVAREGLGWHQGDLVPDF